MLGKRKLKNMNDFLLIILLFVAPILWFFSYIMVLNSEYFFKIFVIHTIILLSYLLFITQSSQFFGLQGGYGLGTMFVTLVVIALHTILGFAHACYITFKKQQPVK